MPSERLLARIRRDFPPGQVDEVVGWLSGLPPEAYGGQNVERMQAALVLYAQGTLRGLAEAVQELRTDWRDLLVAAELANEDWPERLNTELS